MVTTLGEALRAAAVMALTSSLLLTITGPAWLRVARGGRGKAVAQQGVAAGHHAAADQAGGHDAGHEGGDAEGRLALRGVRRVVRKAGAGRVGRARLRLAAVRVGAVVGLAVLGLLRLAVRGLLGLAIGRVAGLGGLALAGLGEPAVRAGVLGRGADLLGIRGGAAGAAGRPDAARRPRRGPAGGSGSRAPGFRLLRFGRRAFGCRISRCRLRRAAGMRLLRRALPQSRRFLVLLCRLR